MNTLDSDPELFELIRGADPMRHPRVQADLGMDTESALRLIASELDRARLRRHHRRRPMLRIALFAGAVAVAAFVVANVASTGNGPAVSPTQAKAMIWRAREALLYPSAAILEQDSVTTLTSPDGSTSTSEGSAASPTLLSLEAQHPGATVDQSPVDYQSALSRLGLAVPQYPPPSGSESGR